MNKNELQKLAEILEKRIEAIDRELHQIASENPLVRGDFDVKVDDIGKSDDDTGQEAVDLDRNQAIVNSLEKERKEISNTLLRIKEGSYGKCENCSEDIGQARLQAVPATAFCISCAKNRII